MEGVRRWLLHAMDEAFDTKAWHGPNLTSSIRGLSAEQAAWVPGPDRHSVWDILLHCAYWKHRVHGRVAEGQVKLFPHPGKDWPRRQDAMSDAAWRSDVALAKDIHARLRATVESLPASELDRPGPGQKRTRLENLFGVASHDVYHAGQIRLLLRLGEASSWS